MKLLSSSSSSSSPASSTATSSTSTYSFDGGFYNSRNAAGFISGVVRCLLCRNSLPTHPADHFRECENESVEQQKLHCDGVEALGTTNIVARLMGLESMPKIDSSSVISRSRSMNSMESVKEIETEQGRHRRAKSFREIPTYLELEDENFFILSFENGSKTGKRTSKERKSNKGSRRIEQRREEKRVIREELKRDKENSSRSEVHKRESVYQKNKENFCNIINNEKEKLCRVNSMNSSSKACRDEILRDTSNVLRSTETETRRNSSAGGIEVVKLLELVRHGENSKEIKIKKKKKKDDSLAVKIIESESDSKNSSPNSVLDLVEFPVDREAPTSEISRLANSKSRRTLWEELKNYRKLNPCTDKSVIINDQEPKAKGVNCAALLQKQDFEGHKHAQMWRDICKFADGETLQSNWITKEISKLGDYEKISKDVEFDILNQMIEEVVDQLAANFSVKI